MHSERFKSLAEGRKRETEIKRLGRKEKLELIKSKKPVIIKEK